MCLVGFLCRPQTVMGTAPFALVMLLLAAAPSAADQLSAPEPQPMAEESFQTLLIEGTLSDLEQGCVEAAAFGLSDRQQQLRDRLLSVNPTPQTIDEVLSNARVLLTCRSPDGARMVLSRYLPGVGAERDRWLRLSWQAADAGLDHPRAARALRRLVNGDLLALEQIELVEAPGASAEPGEPLTVNGLDQLAHHEESAGELLELALDQAAADEAWGLAVDLLRLQLRLQLAAGGDGERPRQRLERLTARLDDQYSSWQLQDGGEPGPALRSPRDPGGHAAVEPLTDAPSP